MPVIFKSLDKAVIYALFNDSQIRNIEYYFEKISGLNGNTFTNFCETFAPGGTSRLYLKLNNNATYNVYIDKNRIVN